MQRWQAKHDAGIPVVDLNTKTTTRPATKTSCTPSENRKPLDAIATVRPDWLPLPVVGAGMVNDIWCGGTAECFDPGITLAEGLAWLETHCQDSLAGFLFLGGNRFVWFCGGELEAATEDNIVQIAQVIFANQPPVAMSLDEMALGLTMHETLFG